MKKLLFVFALLLMFTTSAFALVEVQEADVTDPNALVALLNPVIIFIALQGVKLIKKIAPGWLLGLIIPGLSALGAYLVGLVSPDSSFILTFVLGFGSTFIHQLKVNLLE